MTEVSTRPPAGATKHPPQAQAAAQPHSPAANGYTAGQIALGLGTIAVQAEALRDYLTQAMYRMGTAQATTTHAANDFYVAAQLSILIGSIADQMAGLTHLGTVASWACGDDMEPESGA